MQLTISCICLTLLFLLPGATSVLAFPPSYDVSLLPSDETSQFTLREPASGEDVGTLYESLHLEDRYGLSVFVLTRRFEGDVYEQETVEFEAESFIPIRAIRIQKVRGMNVETEIQFQSTRALITVREPELLGGKTSTTILEIPREAITLQQLPYALRTKPLSPGDQYEFELLPLFGPKQEVIHAKATVDRKDVETGIVEVGVTMGDERWTVTLTNNGVTQSERPFTATEGLRDKSIAVE